MICIWEAKLKSITK